MTTSAAAALLIAAMLIACALSASRVRARWALALAASLLPLPWLVSGSDPARVLVAFATLVLIMSTGDFTTARRPLTFGKRVMYVAGFVALTDSTSAERTPRRVDARAAMRVVVAVLFGGLVVEGWIVATPLPALLRIAVHIVGAAVLVACFAEITSELIGLLAVASGYRFAPAHDRPYRSATLTEFWSRRWNLLGARWFRQHVFLPLRSRGWAVALTALFAVSGVLHAYLIAAVVPVRWMIYCALFFVSQVPLILVERWLGVRRWPPAAGRIWTGATLTTLIPLLVTPLLWALDVSW